MSLYRGEIPGFAWVEARQRYYGIQSGPNYNSAPSNPYSTITETAAAQSSAEREESIARDDQRSRELKIQSKGRLLWEVSRTSRNLDLSTRSKGDNFYKSVLLGSGPATLNPFFKKDAAYVNPLVHGFHDAAGRPFPPALYGNQSKDVESFDYDQETGTLLCGHSVGTPVSQEQFNYHPKITPGSATGVPVQWMSACNVAVSSGSSTVVAEILPVESKVQLLVTRGNYTRPLVTIQPQNDHNSPAINLTFIICHVIRSHAVNPFDTTEGTCALATEFGILTPDIRTGSFKPRFQPSYFGVDDFKAIDFLDRNILIGGGKDIVILWDTRTQGINRQYAERARTMSSVRSIKRADCEQRFVVRGAYGDLVMYDMRFLPQTTLRMEPWMTIPRSKPYLEFPKLPPTATQHVGIDVSVELGLLAVGTLPNLVGLYSLRDAKKVGEVYVGVDEDRRNSKNIDDMPHTIKFRKDQNGAPMMLVATRNGVVKVGI